MNLNTTNNASNISIAYKLNNKSMINNTFTHEENREGYSTRRFEVGAVKLDISDEGRDASLVTHTGFVWESEEHKLRVQLEILMHQIRCDNSHHSFTLDDARKDQLLREGIDIRAMSIEERNTFIDEQLILQRLSFNNGTWNGGISQAQLDMANALGLTAEQANELNNRVSSLINKLTEQAAEGVFMIAPEVSTKIHDTAFDFMLKLFQQFQEINSAG